MLQIIILKWWYFARLFKNKIIVFSKNFVLFVFQVILLNYIHTFKNHFIIHSKIYCTGPLINTIQMSGIFDNSKTFVDMKCQNSAEKTLEEFTKLMNNYPSTKPNNDVLRKFVSENFESIGLEYQSWTPPDFTTNPKFIKKIASKTYKSWAYDLNKLWKKLGRKQVPDVAKNSDRYSIIPLPNPVIISDNSAREVSYGGSFWTIQGLLACEMYDVSIQV